MKNSFNSDLFPSICELRRLGYKVRVSHFRYIECGTVAALERVTKEDKKNNVFSKIFEYGGETHFELTNRDGKTFLAEALCSKRDAFNRKLGNHICLARLAKQGAF